MRISDWSSDVCSSDLPSWNPYAYIKNNWHPDRLKDLEFEIRRGMFEDAMTAEDLERRARELAREKRLMDTMSSGPFFGVLLGSLAAMTTAPSTYIPFPGPIKRSEARRGGKECVRTCI